MNSGVHTAAIPGRSERRRSIWIPFLLVWLLLAPFVVLLAPLVFVACLLVRVNPFRGVAVYWQFFSALRGLRIEVDNPGASISIF